MKKLLLHTCCAPCVAYVYELLSQEYDVTLFYYNPNISPQKEYLKRLAELEKFCYEKKISLLIGEWDNDEWDAAVKPFVNLGEGSERCWICYEYRMKQLFHTAHEKGFAVAATALSISPHKNAQKINYTGNALAAESLVLFYEADFKKRDGFKKSVELSRYYDFYRQDYCGCIYSKMESLERKKELEKGNDFCRKGFK